MLPELAHLVVDLSPVREHDLLALQVVIHLASDDGHLLLVDIRNLAFLNKLCLEVNAQTETRFIIKPVFLTVNTVKLKVVWKESKEERILPFLQSIEVELIWMHADCFNLLQNPVIFVEILHQECLEYAIHNIKGKELPFLIDLLEKDKLLPKWRSQDALELDLVFNLEFVKEFDFKVEVVVDNHFLHGHQIAWEVVNLLGQVPVNLVLLLGELHLSDQVWLFRHTHAHFVLED